MADPKPAEPALLLAALLLIGPAAGAASVPKLSTENINLSADLLNSDTRNDVHVLTGNVRVTQGQLTMESEQATASALQSDHSRWTFERAVHIRTADADLRSNSATAVFAGGQVAEAVVKGTPATFEQRSAAADKNVKGRANLIEYDFGKGVVKMSQDVWFSYGGNEFRGDVVIYNVKEERVVVNPGGNNGGESQGGRVNITIRPGSGAISPGGQRVVPKPPADADKPKPNDRQMNTGESAE